MQYDNPLCVQCSITRLEQNPAKFVEESVAVLAQHSVGQTVVERCGQVCGSLRQVLSRRTVCSQYFVWQRSETRLAICTKSCLSSWRASVGVRHVSRHGQQRQHGPEQSAHHRRNHWRHTATIHIRQNKDVYRAFLLSRAPFILSSANR